ncbi:MAG: hypothetical protein GF384_01305 [Elusimicrobia bacterium]|nr:hypothetical protein [Elusimicrobiota bacterium]
MKKNDLSDPIGTLTILQKAIKQKQWNIAKNCFVSEIQQLNKEIIETEEFYLSDYWTFTQTMQTIISPIPIIAEDASFYHIDSEKYDGVSYTTVGIKYKKNMEKDMRPKSISLSKENNQWKIDTIWGSKVGIRKSLHTMSEKEVHEYFHAYIKGGGSIYFYYQDNEKPILTVQSEEDQKIINWYSSKVILHNHNNNKNAEIFNELMLEYCKKERP